MQSPQQYTPPSNFLQAARPAFASAIARRAVYLWVQAKHASLSFFSWFRGCVGNNCSLIQIISPIISFRNRLFTVLFVVVTALLTMGMGEKYSKEGHALAKKVYEVLIQHGYCTEIRDCNKKLTIAGEHGNRVNIHLYGVTDRKLISIVFNMVLNEGPEITGGAPITLRVYPRPNSEYMGFKSFSKEPIITMEINQ